MRAYLFLLCLGLIGFHSFHKKALAQGTSLVGAEYFFNADPGIGNGTVIPINSGATISFQTLISTSGLSQGFHRLSLRVRDESGFWSFSQTGFFWIERVEANPISPIVAVEYFINTDPGFGNGTALSLAQGPNPQVEGLINVGDLPRGLHRMSVRFRNQANEWSLLSTRLFFIDRDDFDEPTFVDYLEYFFDDDPGLGQAIEILLEEAASTIDLEELIAVAVLEEGEHTITVRIKDNIGQWSIAETREFTVVEPTPGDPPQLDMEFLPGLMAECEFNFGSLVIPTATATDGSSILGTTDESIFPIIQQGTKVIVWTYTDENGLETTQTQNIVIQDVTPPTISLPAEIIVTTNPGQCFASGVDLGTPVTIDNCGIGSVVNNAPSSFPVGLTEVLWTVTDIGGNSAQFVQGVSVQDTQAPVISEVTDLVISTDEGSCSASAVELPIPETTDNCSITSLTNDAPEEFPLGNTIVTWTAIDESGNESKRSFNIIVQDVEAPKITAPIDIVVVIGSSENFVTNVNLGQPEVSDNCAIRVLINDAPEKFDLGNTVVTWKATDESENSTSVTQNILVERERAPNITAPPKLLIETNTNECTATDVNLGTPVVSGQNIANEGISNNAPSAFPIGINIVTWTVVDGQGNSANDIQIVEVVDRDPPVIVLTSILVFQISLDQCSISVDLPLPQVIEDCGISTITGVRSDGLSINEPYLVGNTQIIWTANDESGNESIPKVQQIFVNQNLIGEPTPGELDFCFFSNAEGRNGFEMVTVTANQPDGKIIIGGDFTSYNGTPVNRIARLNPDGSLDNSFNPGIGPIGYNFFDAASVKSIVIQPDGKIIIGGRFQYYNETLVFGIARLNQDGSLDTTFDNSIGLSENGGLIESIALQSDGKIIVIGLFDIFNGVSRGGIVRLNSDGSVDNSFNSGTGVSWTNVNTVAIQPDGKILIGGYFNRYNGITTGPFIRLNENGSLDTSFNVGNGLDRNAYIFASAIQQDGKIIIGGRIESYNNTEINNIARFNLDGSLDTTFDPGLGADDLILTINQQSNGKILIGGSFSSYNGVSRSYIARLDVDGRLDTSFDPGIGANQRVLAINPQPDGKIIIGGEFTSYNGTARGGVARIFGGGTIPTKLPPIPDENVLPVVSAECLVDFGSIKLPTATANDGSKVVGVTEEKIFPISQQGTTVISWIFKDENGLESTQTQNIEIKDVTPPIILLPAEIIVSANQDQCFATGVNLGTPETKDNCGIGSVVNNAPSSFPLGLTEVLWTVTDVGGNTTQFVQIVIVQDTQIPMIASIGDLEISTNEGSCSASGVLLPTPQAIDNCKIESLTNDAPEVFPLGTTVVTWTARDVGGNETTRSINVTVEDREAPSITGPADLNLTIQVGSPGASDVTLGNPNVSDNCGTPSVFNNAPEIFPPGLTVVIWTAEDASGNSSTAEQMVNVSLEEVPGFLTIKAPSNSSVSTDLGSCEATLVDLGSPEVTGNISENGITNDAPASFPIGLTVVTWTATDEVGNTVSDTQNVLVSDNEKPVIGSVANRSFLADPFSCFMASMPPLTPEVSDNCGSVIPVGTRDDGLALTEPYPVGTTLITWTAVDASGNVADPVTQVVFIEYSSGFEFNEFTSEFTIQTEKGQCTAIFEFELPDVNHLCESIVPVGTRSDGLSLSDQYPIGTTSINWEATDSQGKRAISIWNVIVQDSELPEIIPTEKISIETPTGVCSANVSVDVPLAIDNCSVDGLTGTRNDGLELDDAYPVGLTLVTWEAIDAYGNVSVPFVQEIEVLEDYDLNVSPGMLDLGFSSEPTPILGTNREVFAMAMQPDGKILIGGDFSTYNEISRNRLARLNVDGTLDESFNIGSGASGRIRSIALQPDGKIIIAGLFSSFNGESVNSLARLNSDGSLDRTFRNGSLNRNLLLGGTVFTALVLNNGKILIGGNFIAVNRIRTGGLVLLNSDGILDTSFEINPFAFNGTVHSLSLDSNGKIYVGGNFNYGGIRNLIRIDENGNVDTSFLSGSTRIDILNEPTTIVYTVSFFPNGKTYVGGSRSSNQFGTNRSGFLLRIHSEFGDLDTSFDTGVGPNLPVLTSTVQKDGKVIIGGEFNRYGDVSVNRVARLNLEGSLDESFVPPNCSRIRASALQTDGKILIGGAYIFQQGVSRRGIARLYSDPCKTGGCTVNAKAKDLVLRLNNFGRAELHARDVDDGSTLDCPEGTLQFELSKSLFTCNDIGQNKVIFKAIGNDGSEDSAEFNVIVIDEIPPRIISFLPRSFVRTIPIDKQYLLPDFRNIFPARDNCGIMSYTQEPAPDEIIEKLGDYKIILTATDFGGNTSSLQVILTLTEQKTGFFNRFRVLQNNSLITVPWNTSFSSIEHIRLLMPVNDEENEEIQVKWNSKDYNPLVPGLYTIHGTAESELSPITLEELKISVIVEDKPLSEDILISKNTVSGKVQSGEIIGNLNTLDPLDNIHTYTMDEHPNFYIDRNALIWKGSGSPDAQMTVTIHSTDRAGQTISREITLYRELARGEILIYPNPAKQETNILVQLSGPGTVDIRIFDAAGRLVYEEQEHQEGSFVRNVDLKGLSSGMYQVVVQSGNEVMTGRLVKEE